MDGLQVPVIWQESGATQVTGLPPTHVPFWQVSVCVQALPLEQLVPLGAGVCVQVPAEQVSVVQGLLSLQSGGEHTGAALLPPVATVPPVAMEPPVLVVPPVNFDPPVLAPPVALDPPVLDVPPVALEPPVLALPPVALEPPVLVVPPVNFDPPVAALPPVALVPPVLALPPVALEPPVLGAPPVAFLPPVDVTACSADAVFSSSGTVLFDEQPIIVAKRTKAQSARL